MREFCLTAKFLSLESWLISGGIVPEMPASLRLMSVTKELVLSQLILGHLQKCVVADQPVGVGEREERSLDMTSESSAAERRRSRLRKKSRYGPQWRVAMDG